ncbi:MAG: hypothetical protein ACLSUG_01295 [Alistipes shahii]|jgi:hypothetical protein|uniref:hypothetical protein n=1 Tax=Alistipes TaxID=239759 RepID=UPI00210E88BF|nr:MULTISPECIES: hypothetical protein [Alistipes]MCQ5072918.1 hypothetical protein [Alistipes shahii]
MEAWITDQELQEALKIVNTAIEQRLSFDYKTSTLNFLETMSPKFSARFKRYAVPFLSAEYAHVSIKSVPDKAFLRVRNIGIKIVCEFETLRKDFLEITNQ